MSHLKKWQKQCDCKIFSLRLTRILPWVLVVVALYFQLITNTVYAENLDHNLLATELNENDDSNAQKIAIEDADNLEQDAQTTLSLIQQSHAIRDKLPTFITNATQEIKVHKGALPAKYAEKIIDNLYAAEIQRDGLFRQAIKHRSALYRVDDISSDAVRINEIIVGLSAAATLFENSKILRDTFANNSLLREKLNEGYPEFGVASNYYDSSLTRAVKPEYVKTMNDAVQYFNQNKNLIAANVQQSSPTIQALYGYLANSPELVNVGGGHVFKEIASLPVKLIGGVVQLLDNGLRKLQFKTSQVVGNAMGLVRWRDGKLKNNQTVLAEMLATLQPGDILLEKTPFALTDKSIPGYFGHAAIYTGNIEQLEAIHAFDAMHIAKNREKIATGHVVAEALRNGVKLDKLEDFMNIDDVAILRLKDTIPEQQRETVNLALANLGKKYDFNYDVNTTDTIVCSELVYLAYPQVDFITKRVLGSFTVTPNDIAEQAVSVNTAPLEVVLFAHDGKMICGPQTENRKARLALYDDLVAPVPSHQVTVKSGAVEDFINHQ